MQITRRDALKTSGLAGLAAAGLVVPLGGAGVQAKEASDLRSANFPPRYVNAFQKPPVLEPYRWTRDPDGAPRAWYRLTQRQADAQILPGLTTPIWGYDGIFPGPTIRVEQGTRVRLRVRNELPVTHPDWGTPMNTSVHLHGSASKPQYDGYASDITRPGGYKDYDYPNTQSARTLWYHDHGVHYTAQNVYAGMAAQYHLHSPLEEELLPQGDFDVPLVVSDAMFARDGRLAYDDRSTSGLWGDVILVNGVPWPKMKVQRRVYRFRCLNASISRSYRFRLSNRAPVTMVATDGGMMPRSRNTRQWRHASAERYEFLVDFSQYEPGTTIDLQNRSNDNNRDFDHTNKVMRFEVTDEPVDTGDPTWNRIPTVLNPDNEVMALKPAQSVKRRNLRVERHNGNWAINDTIWEDVVASGFQNIVADPELDAVEIWDLENKSGGWFHPVHIHLVDFQILSRNGRKPFVYERGPKDVAYIGENETVTVLARFGPHRGRYMVHCHNLPHEDHDMMVQYAVGWKPGDDDPDHPIDADPSRPHDGRGDDDIDIERYPDAEDL